MPHPSAREMLLWVNIYHWPNLFLNFYSISNV